MHPSRTQTVLVVEDDLVIRMMASHLVEDLGFAFLEASNADEAILLLEQHDEITVVFTDIHMPGSIDGLQLAALTRARRPDVGLVIVSGEHVPQADQIPIGAKFFSKPYDPSAVQAALMQMSSYP